MSDRRRARWLALILTTCLAATQAAACALGAPPSTDVYDEALRAYREGRFADAARLLEPLATSQVPRSFHLSLLGWSHLRLAEIPAAKWAFTRASEIDPASADALAGLGYVALREGSPVEAEGRFRAAQQANPEAADALTGLGLALHALGRVAEARDALTRALALNGDDAEARRLLAEIRGVVQVERRPRPPVPAGAALRAPVRAVGERFEIVGARSSRPLFVVGVNLSTALPGRFATEFPDDPALYRRWFTQMADLGVNAVRLYTLHPPSLYRALHEHNTSQPSRKLWLLQGVWSELPPDDDFDDPDFRDDLLAEIRRIIDALHGNLELPPRPGHAAGVYDTDVAEHVLGLIIGREWEPFVVDAYARAGIGTRRHDGRYVRADGARPFEAWLAAVLDAAAAHSTEYYRWQHPLAFTSWPTLDPLSHPTETSFVEERALRGEPVAVGAERPFDNDLAQVDPRAMHATRDFRAGLFAAYHVYPYHPDFMILDPTYARAAASEGGSRYRAYLEDLRRHHAGMPLLVAEFGVPTSRGVSHVHPDGMHHGGHTAREQAAIELRLLDDIRRTRLAGGVLFAWIDEWFKRNWLTIHFESPPERDPLWLNMLDPEEHYGLLAARPGSGGWKIELDGKGDDWTAAAPHQRSRTGGALHAVHVDADAAYLYLRIDLDPTFGGLPSTEREIWIGVDTYDAERGDHAFPAPASLRTPIGMEFLMRLAGRPDSRLRVDAPYDLFTNQGRRPYRSLPNDDGEFVDIRPETNRERLGRDGTRFPARFHDRSLLRYGSTDAGSADHDDLADWFASTDGSLIEARIPWGLLNVADPSSRRVIHEERRSEGPVETRVTEGFRFHVLALRRAGDALVVVDALPAVEPAPRLADFPLYAWPTWERPDYRLEPKESYYILQRALRDAHAADVEQRTIE